MTQNVITIRLNGGVERAFYYRPKTSDEAVVNDVFARDGYNLRRIDRTPRQKRHDTILSFLARMRKTGKKPLIVDAGANIGATALYFISEYPDALVVSIEPDPSNFTLLAKNVDGLNVEGIQAAVSSRQGRARMVDLGEGHWGLRAELAEDGSVPCVTIADIYRKHTSTHFPFIVKVDIEGGEYDLFSADTEWVAQTPVLIVELHDWLIPGRGISRPFLRCVAGLDRDLINVGENCYSIANKINTP